MRIGVIGLGSMGKAIAANLLAAGHKVTVFNRTRSKADALLAEGALFAETPGAAAGGDAVITMLSDDLALESIAFGIQDLSNGLIYDQGGETIHISMSTISAQLSRRITDASLTAGKPFVSAPVMGRPDVAQRGELIVMAAGDSTHIDRCMPVFDIIGRVVHRIGEHPVQANVTKLAANFMISSMIETFGEALALVRKSEVDPQQFHQIMATDFFKSPIYEKYGKLIVEENFGGGAFTVRLQEKDTRLALAAAIESQVPMPFLTVLENAFLTAIGRGKGELDPCAIASLASEGAGLSPQNKSKV